MDADNDDDLEFGRKAYAVRLAQDRQVVGIFVAEDTEELAYLVDQCCDPAGTEYLRLGVGGVYVGSPTTAQWPARSLLDDEGKPMDIEPEDDQPLRGASIDNFWWRDISDGDWFPLMVSAVPSKTPPRKPLAFVRRYRPPAT